MLFDIDWQGTQQLAETARDDLVSVFILPPSAAELERRLHSRAQDSAAVIAQRMAKASDEMSHWAEYDYVIVNDDLDLSVVRIRAILAAERLKRRRQAGQDATARPLTAAAGRLTARSPRQWETAANEASISLAASATPLRAASGWAIRAPSSTRRAAALRAISP